MQCGICRGRTNQRDGEHRDLGDEDRSLVCPDCQAVADKLGRDGEEATAEGDREVSTKYAV
ncbi:MULTISPECIES: hypothetical protein [Halorussus]|uniref:hypothetical protein n=1 Tax=Halorussus TaxID=1070314 RepID=UPI00209C8242|nr:hypothetical protein [Halorussus vallis]USZ78614.1 hypothetical protein NGM07_25025 [Halorussus vallis]